MEIFWLESLGYSRTTESTSVLPVRPVHAYNPLVQIENTGSQLEETRA